MTLKEYAKMLLFVIIPMFAAIALFSLIICAVANSEYVACALSFVVAVVLGFLGIKWIDYLIEKEKL